MTQWQGEQVRRQGAAATGSKSTADRIIRPIQPVAAVRRATLAGGKSALSSVNPVHLVLLSPARLVTGYSRFFWFWEVLRRTSDNVDAKRQIAVAKRS
ncbi:MAG: hypothetical protein Q8O63_08565, partial [Hoeflea sp.]|nr:hypothetical protein [Hoeflea sp.]